MEEHFNKNVPPDEPSVASSKKLELPGNKELLGTQPTKVVDSNKSPTPSYHSTPWTYPPQQVPMPHMNPSGNPSKLDECNFSF
jgi:hypothetical protein